MKHEIEIEGLPEGWKAVAYRVPSKYEYTLSDDWMVVPAKGIEFPVLIIEKMKPRRIALDLTQHEYSLLLKIPIEQRLFDDPVMFDLVSKIKSAEVKEN